MKKISVAVLLLLFFTACNKSVQDNTVINLGNKQQDQLLSAKEINGFIQSEVQQKGSFDWKDASPSMVWSALQLRDKVMCIGYKPATLKEIGDLSTINLNELQWKAAKEAILDIIYNEEIKRNPSLKKEDLEVWKESKLPVIDVKIESSKTI